MSDGVTLALIAGCGAALASIVAAIPQTIIALRTKKQAEVAATQSLANGEKADKAVERADQLMSKTDAIQSATNGNLTEIKQQLGLALQEIEGLKVARTLATETSASAVQAALATPAPNEKAAD